MRLSVSLSDIHPGGADPLAAREHYRTLLAAARDRLDGVTLAHGWASSRWNPQALTLASYLSGVVDAARLGMTVRRLPLGVLNPVELAEQLATVDHAWGGALRASVVVGTDGAFAALGVDRALGAVRFSEGVDIIRRMWTAPAFAGAGPQFVFSEVRPTLRPVRPGGPPLQVEVTGPDGLDLARRLGLGVHLVGGDLAGWDIAGWDVEEVVRMSGDWRGSGGSGDLSVELDPGRATTAVLGRLAEAGFDQVDVQLAPADGGAVSVLRVIDDLARSREVIGGR